VGSQARVGPRHVHVSISLACLGDDEDFLRRRTRTGAIAAHLLKAASTAPDA
jgi:hypothetical protein